MFLDLPADEFPNESARFARREILNPAYVATCGGASDERKKS
jgi:hypothetical protein